KAMAISPISFCSMPMMLTPGSSNTLILQIVAATSTMSARARATDVLGNRRNRCLFMSVLTLTARGESLAAFDERCIPTPPQRGCRVGGPGAGGVAPPSNTPGILSRRALPAGRLARLGATPDFHRGLLAALALASVVTANRMPAPVPAA